MKRLFLLFFLVTSFFFFSKECFAEELYITYDDYSLVKSDSFKLVLESVKETAELNNYSYYAIVQHSTSLNYYVLYSNSTNPFSIGYKKESSSSNYYYVINVFYKLREKYNSSGVLDSSSLENSNVSSYYRIASVEPAPSMPYYFLYSNIDILFLDYRYDLIVSYPDIIYTFNNKSEKEIFLSLYNVYLTYGDVDTPDIHEEEKGLLLSFYSYIIEKISYLANIFASNYIFLTIIGIFILIYVIELFRRLLR